MAGMAEERCGEGWSMEGAGARNMAEAGAGNLAAALARDSDVDPAVPITEKSSVRNAFLLRYAMNCVFSYRGESDNVWHLFYFYSKHACGYSCEPPCVDCYV